MIRECTAAGGAHQGGDGAGPNASAHVMQNTLLPLALLDCKRDISQLNADLLGHFQALVCLHFRILL